jgi:hypothetical protein
LKRFTDTEKWSDPWFRKLPLKFKALWLYLVDNCDHAGIWKTDLELAAFYVGDALTESDLQTHMAGRLVNLGNGKIFIPKFIGFQYGQTLNPENPAHRGVIKALEGAKKGLSRAFVGPQEKEQEKEKVKDSGKEGCGEKTQSSGEVPTVTEVIQFGSMGAGVPADFCEYYHNEKETKLTWHNGQGKLINWRKEIVTWWNGRRHTWGKESTHKGGFNNGPAMKSGQEKEIDRMLKM